MENNLDVWPRPENANFSAMPATTQNALLYFGQMLLRSFAPEKQYTVSEWIDHVIDSKSCAGRKRKTISGYHYCAIRIKRIMGHMRLCDVQPTDISNLLNQLKEESTQPELRATLRSDIAIQDILSQENISKTRLAKVAGISQSTVDRALQGYNILLPKAAAIATALHYNTEDLFQSLELEKPLSSTTLEDYRRFISLVFSAAERELQIPFNPVSRTEKVSTRRKKKVKILQLDEVQEVLAAAEKEPIDKRCLLHLFLITGGRRGEIAGLRWSRVNWDENAIMIDHEILYTPEDGTYSEDTTKSGQDRLIRLPTEAMNILRDYKQWQDLRKLQLGDKWIGSDYIFTSRFGGPISPETISGYIHRFQEKYDLPTIHPHKFRHTHASVLLYSGMDMVTVSKRLGHLEVSTTQDYYAHLIQQADVESAECIADAIYRGKKVSAPKASSFQ